MTFVSMQQQDYKIRGMALVLYRSPAPSVPNCDATRILLLPPAHKTRSATRMVGKAPVLSVDFMLSQVRSVGVSFFSSILVSGNAIVSDAKPMRVPWAGWLWEPASISSNQASASQAYTRGQCSASLCRQATQRWTALASTNEVLQRPRGDDAEEDDLQPRAVRSDCRKINSSPR